MRETRTPTQPSAQLLFLRVSFHEWYYGRESLGQCVLLWRTPWNDIVLDCPPRYKLVSYQANQWGMWGWTRSPCLPYVTIPPLFPVIHHSSINITGTCLNVTSIITWVVLEPCKIEWCIRTVIVIPKYKDNNDPLLYLLLRWSGEWHAADAIIGHNTIHLGGLGQLFGIRGLWKIA